MPGTRLPNLSLIAVAAAYFVQIGAQFFALATVARTVSMAPPRSLAILHGEYPYDSSAFWQVVPPLVGALFLIAVVANWRTSRRSLLLGALAAFVLMSVVTVVWLQPLFAEIAAAGYGDTVDPLLQRRAASWYTADWLARLVDGAAGITLLVALTRPPVASSTAA